MVAAFKTGSVPRTLVLISPVLHIPVELEKDVTIVDFPLPTETEIRRVLDGMIAANSTSGRIRIAFDELGRERFAKAALGLTPHEAENAFARALVNDGVLDGGDLAVVHEEKRQTVRKSGLLEFVDAPRQLRRRRRAGEPQAVAGQTGRLLAGRGGGVRSSCCSTSVSRSCSTRCRVKRTGSR